jgi:hypothetical protein
MKDKNKTEHKNLIDILKLTEVYVNYKIMNVSEYIVNMMPYDCHIVPSLLYIHIHSLSSH